MTTKKCHECFEPATIENEWMGQAFCAGCDRNMELTAERAMSPVECCVCGDVRSHDEMHQECAHFLRLTDLNPADTCSICCDCWNKPLEDLARLREDAQKRCA